MYFEVRRTLTSLAIQVECKTASSWQEFYTKNSEIIAEVIKLRTSTKQTTQT